MAAITYQLLSGSTSVQRSDGAVVPDDLGNRDWVTYQAWLTAGNTPTAAAPPAAPPETPAQSAEAAVDAFRDQLLATGFVDSVTAKTWQCDEISRGFLTGLGASAGLALTQSPQPTYALIPSDNTTVVLDATDTYALINGRIMPWVSRMVIYGRTLKNDILAGNPPADYTQGWPQT